MKYENLALEIKIIPKFNNVSIYPLVVSAEGVITRNAQKYRENVGLTKSILRVPLQKCHILRKFLTTRPLTLRGQDEFPSPDSPFPPTVGDM